MLEQAEAKQLSLFSPIVGQFNGKKVFLAGKKPQQQASQTNLDAAIVPKDVSIKPKVKVLFPPKNSVSFLDEQS